ncbi:unnamed protein product, partial [Phaeothamnion confervicola]
DRPRVATGGIQQEFGWRIRFSFLVTPVGSSFGGDAAAAGSAALPVLLSLPNGDDSEGE